jgi:Icc-related predicted phosphoesterase
MRITFISDTHNNHKIVTNDLPGGDLLIHAGDISSRGSMLEISNFAEWFNSLDGYKHKVFIAGNHDFGFENNHDMAKTVIQSFPNISYLEDSELIIQDEDGRTVRIYGSPWQPEFYDWAFNLPRQGWVLEQKWKDIPEETDILITHGPAYGFVDTVIGRPENLGCELLAKRIASLKPSIHVCGHIHTGYGQVYSDGTNYFNASLLDESYRYSHKPITIDWNPSDKNNIIHTLNNNK